MQTLSGLLRRRWVVALWLLLLSVYAFAGMPIASFHGDEPMQIYMSHDYAEAFIYRNLEPLTRTGPYNVDSDVQLRILNGSINRYVIGLSWHLAGYNTGDLPPAPGWDWGLDYDTNVATNHRPVDGLLFVSRATSTLFLAMSIAVMFALGWQLGGLWVAYVASALYALNPVILLNGRRAMMEGALLCFGLLVILVAVFISRRLAQGQRAGWGWWLALIVAAALAVNSKHSGVVYVGGAFGWVWITSLLQRRGAVLLRTTVYLLLSGLLAVALFVATSPALWNDVPARLRDLINARADLLAIQVTADPAGAMSLGQRLEQIITQPFMMPLAHYEAGGWTDFSVIGAEIDRYMVSPLSGWQFGPVVGAVLMLLALVGLVHIARGAVWRWGGAVWLLATLAMLLTNPLPWQRYYLPLIPIVTLLAALGLMVVLVRFVHRPEQDPSKRPIVTDAVPPHTKG